MKVLVIGSGGREHVLAWKIQQSPLVKEVFCAPGNGGMARCGECVAIASDNIGALVDFAKSYKIDLTVVGPEAPLAAGIVDVFEGQGLKVFGPHRLAARLEGSKIFAKEFMQQNRIPTARFVAVEHMEAVRAFLRQVNYPIVVKADGLAAGKGVVICADKEEVLRAASEMMEARIFADAGARVVMEEFLNGEEVSILAICDGEHYQMLPEARDHKRIFDDDLGPNTGGMGAFSPTGIVNASLMSTIETSIIRSTLNAMKKQGTPFKGVLYAGLMLTDEGPKVLEYNVRFGDPEIQAVLPRLKTDLVEVLLACVEGRLDEIRLRWDPRACVCVVMSSGGYPGKYEKGFEIRGLETARAARDVEIFHAGTKAQGEKTVTDGGRVLGVTALGDDIESAITKAYAAVEQIHFNRAFFRRDIGAQAVKKYQV